MLAYGDFDTEEMKDAVWIVFLGATVLLPLLMLNLLIAIISDTFERVYSNRVASDYKEKAAIVLEFENLMFWNRDRVDMAYLHTIKYKVPDGQDSNEWDGKINQMKKEIGSRIDAAFRQQKKDIEEMLNNRMRNNQ